MGLLYAEVLGLGDHRRARSITKSGVIFIGASMDSRVRAIDLKTGKVLWAAWSMRPPSRCLRSIPTRARNMWCSLSGATPYCCRRSATRLSPSLCRMEADPRLSDCIRTRASG